MDDMYSDAPEAGEGQEHPMPEEDAHEDYGGETALLPKAILAGKDFQPGEEIVLEIVKMHDDQVEVKYASDKGKEGKEEPTEMEEAPMPQGMGGGSDTDSMYQ